MPVQLFMEPSTPAISWDDFVANYPEFSIAIDGFVADGPKYSDAGPHRNFNHHDFVDRLPTRATCGQILVDIRQGMFDRFRLGGQPHALVYANDCDEDVCLSWYLLQHAYAAAQVYNPALNKLVHMEDMLDATAGAYPFPRDLPALRELAWIFQPYRMFRKSGELDKREATSYRAVVEDVCLRIERFLVGQGQTVDVNSDYFTYRHFKGWQMLDEGQSGEYGRTGLFADGGRAYVSFRERPDGNWVYTLGRMSPYVDFDVPRHLAALDEAEGNLHDHWGGGNSIGGSPRTCGSRLNPDEAADIINA